jgi:hypothetical protein
MFKTYDKYVVLSNNILTPLLFECYRGQIWIVVTSTADKKSVKAALGEAAFPVEVFSLV